MITSGFYNLICLGTVYNHPYSDHELAHSNNFLELNTFLVLVVWVLETKQIFQFDKVS